MEGKAPFKSVDSFFEVKQKKQPSLNMDELDDN
jgi:hypothetical protein